MALCFILFSARLSQGSSKMLCSLLLLSKFSSSLDGWNLRPTCRICSKLPTRLRTNAPTEITARRQSDLFMCLRSHASWSACLPLSKQNNFTLWKGKASVSYLPSGALYLMQLCWGSCRPHRSPFHSGQVHCATRRLSTISCGISDPSQSLKTGSTKSFPVLDHPQRSSLKGRSQTCST